MASLRLGLHVLLRLFAPTLPYITEEVWAWAFAEETGHPLIHGAPWPTAEEFTAPAPKDGESLELAIAALAAINKAKADGEVSMGREVEHLVLEANAETLDRVSSVLPDVLAATRCHAHETSVRADLEAGSFAVRDARFAPKPEKA